METVVLTTELTEAELSLLIGLLVAETYRDPLGELIWRRLTQKLVQGVTFREIKLLEILEGQYELRPI